MHRLTGRRTLRDWRRPSRGFTLIELVVVICIVSVLATVAADRILYFQERAEKAAMDATLAAVKMGLQIRLAELIIANRQMAASQLEREDPMRWLAEPPRDYLGEYRVPTKPGSWYFAADTAGLIYVPNNTKYLQLNQSDKVELRFRVKLYYDEIEISGNKVRSLTGVGLLPVKPFRWF